MPLFFILKSLSNKQLLPYLPAYRPHPRIGRTLNFWLNFVEKKALNNSNINQ